MRENKMGYRGSKSVKFYTVKEQRVYGSWPKLLGLRFTLMGCESSYPIKIPSNQLNYLKHYYSSSPACSGHNFSSAINPYFITGFSDAEASFIVLILKEPKHKTKWAVKIRFSIGLHKKDKEILELIQSYFCGIGTISAQSKDSVQYRVSSLKELTNIIIPHFDMYSLLTQVPKGVQPTLNYSKK